MWPGLQMILRRRRYLPRDSYTHSPSLGGSLKDAAKGTPPSGQKFRQGIWMFTLPGLRNRLTAEGHCRPPWRLGGGHLRRSLRASRYHHPGIIVSGKPHKQSQQAYQ